ncbi:hypothetical protein JTM65_37060, partial [Pseudomonas aeruginosa]|nr:hypothetical protein [Pseudomonas aeruginosa]
HSNSDFFIRVLLQRLATVFFHQTGEQRRADGDNVIVKVVAGVVHHATALLPFLAIAEQEVAAWALAQHKSEILAGVHRRDRLQDPFAAKHLQ